MAEMALAQVSERGVPEVGMRRMDGSGADRMIKAKLGEVFSYVYIRRQGQV